MLPGEPKIFHGRNAELDIVVKMLAQESSRIAILGGGGMGKTTLAKAVLHHSTVVAGYERRLFVATDSATNSLGLAALVGAYIGLKPGKDLTRPVVRYFSGGPPCLLILDNLETSWEPITSRTGVEDFLSLLSEIPHLALIVSTHHLHAVSFSSVDTNTDYNARCGATCQSALEPSISLTIEGTLGWCCTPDLHRCCR
jgi:GTPase SAR1 family protein